MLPSTHMTSEYHHTVNGNWAPCLKIPSLPSCFHVFINVFNPNQLFSSRIPVNLMRIHNVRCQTRLAALCPFVIDKADRNLSKISIAMELKKDSIVYFSSTEMLHIESIKHSR